MEGQRQCSALIRKGKALRRLRGQGGDLISLEEQWRSSERCGGALISKGFAECGKEWQRKSNETFSKGVD